MRGLGKGNAGRKEGDLTHCPVSSCLRLHQEFGRRQAEAAAAFEGLQRQLGACEEKLRGLRREKHQRGIFGDRGGPDLESVVPRRRSCSSSSLDADYAAAVPREGTAHVSTSTRRRRAAEENVRVRGGGGGGNHVVSALLSSSCFERRRCWLCSLVADAVGVQPRAAEPRAGAPA